MNPHMRLFDRFWNTHLTLQKIRRLKLDRATVAQRTENMTTTLQELETWLHQANRATEILKSQCPPGNISVSIENMLTNVHGIIRQLNEEGSELQDNTRVQKGLKAIRDTFIPIGSGLHIPVLGDACRRQLAIILEEAMTQYEKDGTENVVVQRRGRFRVIDNHKMIDELLEENAALRGMLVTREEEKAKLWKMIETHIFPVNSNTTVT